MSPLLPDQQCQNIGRQQHNTKVPRQLPRANLRSSGRQLIRPAVANWIFRRLVTVLLALGFSQSQVSSDRWEFWLIPMKWETWNMKRYKFKHPPIQSNLVLQYFVTNMHNTNLPDVNSKDLSESFCLITTKFFLTTASLSSLIWYVFMFLSLSMIWCTLTPSDALARFYGGGRQRLAWAQRPVGEGRWLMSLSGPRL